MNFSSTLDSFDIAEVVKSIRCQFSSPETHTCTIVHSAVANLTLIANRSLYPLYFLYSAVRLCLLRCKTTLSRKWALLRMRPHTYAKGRCGETEVFNNVFHNDMCGLWQSRKKGLLGEQCSLHDISHLVQCTLHLALPYCQIELPETWRKMKLLMTLAVGGKVVAQPSLTNLCNHCRYALTHTSIQMSVLFRKYEALSFMAFVDIYCCHNVLMFCSNHFTIKLTVSCSLQTLSCLSGTSQWLVGPSAYSRAFITNGRV